MNTKILLMTHEDIGAALLKTADKTFGQIPIETTVIGVHYDTEPEDLLPKLQQLAKQLTADDSMLVLTDMFGSTPCNLALTLKDDINVRVISGLNLPMLIRVMNYPDLELNDLAEKAISGGKDGVVDCTS